GEDGTIQALLELEGVPYTGSGVAGSALAMDKDASKRVLRDAGVATPAWLVDPPDGRAVATEIGLPAILKPVSGGSSVHLVLATSEAEADRALAEARERGESMMAEAFVRGRELTVGIVGTRALPVGEIVPRHELFDYTCKYEPGMADEIFPAELDEAVAARAQEQALAAHRALGLRDVSRVDFILADDGVLWCLEANTIPGLTGNSLLPRAARAAGMSMAELCDAIVHEALARRGAARAG
ncbi:MAG: D-alanine--D-alanine ligase, partial [Gemmatimonadetes bacterium]